MENLVVHCCLEFKRKQKTKTKKKRKVCWEGAVFRHPSIFFCGTSGSSLAFKNERHAKGASSSQHEPAVAVLTGTAHTHTHSGAVLASMVSKITILFMLILFLFPNMLFDRHPRSERHDKCFCSSGLVFAQYAKNVPLRSKWKIMSYPNTEFNLVVPYELRI